MDSLYFQGDPGSTIEEEMWNGLYKGHAYSVTHMLEVKNSVENKFRGACVAKNVLLKNFFLIDDFTSS